MENSVDLAALDALYQAATPGEWEAVDWCVEVAGGYVVAECHDYDEKGITGEPNAALIAALHNAWPALRRRLEIGDAAVEVEDAKTAEWAAYTAWSAADDIQSAIEGGSYHGTLPNGMTHDEFDARVAALDAAHNEAVAATRAARAKLRTLREAQNG